MNYMKRVVALCLVLVLSVGAITVSATETVTATDQKATVTFQIKGVYSLNGTFSIEDENEIVESYDCRVADFGGMKGGNINGNSCFLYETSNPAKARDITLEVNLKLKATAAVNQRCYVTFTFEKGTDEEGLTVESDEMTVEVKVGQKKNTNTQTPDTEDDSTNPSTEPTTEPTEESATKPSTEPTTEPSTTPTTDKSTNTTTNKNNSTSSDKTNNNKTNTTKPTEPEIDYDKLKENITIAEGLKKEDYPEDDWKKLDEVLQEAKKLTDSDNQEKVDEAAQKLADAIVALVGVDYAKLRAAIDRVATVSQDSVISSLWYQMIDAMDNAQNLLKSTDQNEIDDGAEQLEMLLDAIEKAAASAESTLPQVPSEEAPATTEPAEEDCNVPMHKIWPILFLVSVFLNIAFTIVILIYVIRKMKNQKDDTPLVDYDISDDEFDDLDDLDDPAEEFDDIGIQ